MKTYTTESGRTFRIIEQADDVTDSMLVQVARCVEDYFPPGSWPLVDADFIDCLCTTYADDWDIEMLDTPAVRKIMRHAREIRRELV